MNIGDVKSAPTATRTLLFFVLDRPGVLNKIAMQIRRSMYNTDTITVCGSKQPGISRMTIVLKADRDDKIIQIIT
jgi:acetolactate synthase-1/3 small subunit